MPAGKNASYQYLDGVEAPPPSPPRHGTGEQPLSSLPKTLGNFFISFVGSGVLGLPFAFRQSGLFTGMVVMIAVSMTASHCMLMLVECRKKIEGDKGMCSYNELSGFALGIIGKKVTEYFLVISQVGFVVAYLVFIGHNLGPMVGLPPWAVVLMVLPFEVGLALVRSLTALAPFSLLADAVNVLAICTVFSDDIMNFNTHKTVQATNGWGSIPFIFGVALYCYEGMGLVLPLESSMRDRAQFPGTLMLGMLSITSLFIGFGAVGYCAFGETTHDIITMNLPKDWTTTMVKVSICFSLSFTYPVMMVPVYEIIERNLLAHPRFDISVSPSNRRGVFSLIRVVLVCISGFVASAVPGFGLFISLIGSTCCAALAFIFPPLIHLKIFDEELSRKARLKNWLIISVGFVGAVLGTLDTARRIYYGVDDGGGYRDSGQALPPPPYTKPMDPAHGPTVFRAPPPGM